ncbi:MAG TPA: hypothetical protein VIT92_17030, partial [Burkholderiaceae bacterium]
MKMLYLLSPRVAQQMRWSVSGVLFACGVIGLAVHAAHGLRTGWPLWPVAALLTGALCWYRVRGTHLSGALYAALHVATYHPYAGGWSYTRGMPLSLAYVAHLPGGVLVLNLLAVLLLGACLL